MPLSYKAEGVAEIVEEVHNDHERKWFTKLFRTAVLRDSEESKFVRKLDLYLLTWGCIAYLIKSIDQSNYSNAYVSGMKEDLNIVGNEYNWISIYFNIGYAVGLIPSQISMTRLSTPYWLSSCEFIWGNMTLCCAFVKSVHVLFPLRFLIGLFESSAWPGMMTIFYNYYTQKELATRAALFTGSYYAGSMFTGFMQAAIYKTLNGHGGLAGWKWLFVINGLMTVAIASLGFYIVPDSPQNGVEHEKGIKIPLDYRVWLFLLAYVPAVWTTSVAYFNLWLKSLKTDDGSSRHSVEELNLIPIAGSAVQLITIVTLSKLADFANARLIVLVAENIIQLVGSIILATRPKSIGINYFSYFLLFAQGANTPILISFLPEIWATAPDLRAIITGVTVAVVYANNAWLPLFLWPANEAPEYKYGYKVTCGLTGASSVGTVLFYFLAYKRSIRKLESKIDSEETLPVNSSTGSSG
ncbi:hypothetical protein KL949_001516 [Ogataea haglerorum]|nr:hypothetical protein KL913_001906 [Ogataea haglerorum]KAG7721784.1 hypothetical protein KL949_001516 [Ogataea haglerorum]KAG7759424.1 hypothetical protein KL947_001805 [Ogataea haglerorum]KAG7770112.1 hypothetical protein KL931_002631 [Ogataea haglerorum]